MEFYGCNAFSYLTLSTLVCLIRISQQQLPEILANGMVFCCDFCFKARYFSKASFINFRMFE